jgi:2-polyprenyl-6-hydroxyphenyl methylase/3-demethylubiquinone-9 3-methyltransferase
MNGHTMRYGFGANWQSYIDTALSPARIERAAASMRQMLGVADLSGRSFLDIGCGSGIFSLAACRLGAERVEGFDYDADSVRASLAVRERSGIPAGRWRVQQGSVLDRAFMAGLAQADIVYSWGVLHHTGSMWEAIRAAALRTRPGGLFALSIYNEVRGPLMSSARWHRIKQAYNRSPAPARRLMEGAYAAAFMLKDAAALRNPLATIRRYNSDDERGMDFWHDVHDWLGGFPYEYASAGAIFAFLHQELGLQLTHLNTSYGAGCNEFTFRRTE